MQKILSDALCLKVNVKISNKIQTLSWGKFQPSVPVIILPRLLKKKKRQWPTLSLNSNLAPTPSPETCCFCKHWNAQRRGGRSQTENWQPWSHHWLQSSNGWLYSFIFSMHKKHFSPLVCTVIVFAGPSQIPGMLEITGCLASFPKKSLFLHMKQVMSLDPARPLPMDWHMATFFKTKKKQSETKFCSKPPPDCDP